MSVDNSNQEVLIDPGFIVKEDNIEAGVIIIKEVELIEISLVPVEWLHKDDSARLPCEVEK